MNPSKVKPPTFQELILRLQTFWAERGCVLQQPYDVEVGAGTMAPETFLRVLGPKPYKVAYVQPSRRPADGRYGENPNRLYKHRQLQVILKPPPENVQDLYLESLGAMGIDLRQHDIKTGWVKTYGDVRLADEMQFSVYNFEMADVEKTWKHFELCEAECKALLDEYSELIRESANPLHKVEEVIPRLDGKMGHTVSEKKKRFPLLAAYDLCLKCSHLFNILDARGAISVTERVGVIARVRALAVGIAKAWVDQQRGEFPAEEEEGTRAGKKHAQEKEKLSSVGS